MLDFLIISTRSPKKGIVEVYPKFIIKRSNDLMIRGGDFYAIWIEERGLWSTDEQDAIQLIDHELDIFANEYSKTCEDFVKVLHVWDAESGMIDRWLKYCQHQMPDNYHMLDEKLIFSNTPVHKRDYASHRLPYPLEEGKTDAWDKLVGTLYSDEERHKIEWSIGSIVSGDSKKLQKFVVFYGAAGTGKSTVLNVIQQLFDGYYSVFDAKALGSSNNAFALEAFKSNPLVAIQHDGDLSRIEDNTRLNSLVSHELMTVNEKFKSTYSNRFKCFLFMGTNKPVKITDAKSGLIRRLIDISPSGNKLNHRDYHAAIKQISFELGAIAWRCQEVYMEDPTCYDDYVPITMLGASNDFYNYVIDSFYIFKKENGTTLKAAWEMYKQYCDDAKVTYPFTQRIFKEELKNYFQDYKERFTLDDGTRVRSYYIGFREDRFEPIEDDAKSNEPKKLELTATKSLLDSLLADCPAQYANHRGTPAAKWDQVVTTLKDISTSQLHYVKVPLNHIVVDFDIPDENGEKSREKNLAEAAKWPPTYAEFSKSGAGVHLHYIYGGDVTKLNRIYDDHIEIKIFNGNSSLRRKLSFCNTLPIATINSGLPLKGEKNVVNTETIQSEKSLRAFVKRNLNKEIHANTKPSIDFIYKKLEDAYASGMSYDISDMRNAVLAFAANSTHQAEACVKIVSKMKFKSQEPSEIKEESTGPIVFFDVEVFPNLFLVNWKVQGEGKPVVRMINPTASDISELLSAKYRLVGFNCRRYDNHMLYARMIDPIKYDNPGLYKLSQTIINGHREAFFSEAYNVSYTDIYDFASAGNKKSLKKLEIEMGIHHQELGLPWDQPVPEELWVKVAEYCDNDVLATEAAFNYLKADWTARQILADLAGMTVNDSTNTLTQRIIFGKDKNPQTQFNYRNLAEPVPTLDDDTIEFLQEACPEMMESELWAGKSILPYFPGYLHDFGKSTYRGEEINEGGKVDAIPGMYGNVALLDISSMHPHSAIAEVLFGVKYTKAFRDIVEGRVSIKHEAWDEVSKMLNGKLTPYIERVKNGELSSGDLADALKTAINAVYGQTFASYDNPFRDKRNKDNIVAKRGALFMTDLKYEVMKRGFTVAHIKTDSIKIPDATPEIISFVMWFGKQYGYTFEHEATYDRMCLVNDAVYVAKYATIEKCYELYGKEYVDSSKDICKKNKKNPGKWTATGTQFQVPYVFKKLFTKEPITFEDLCETKSVTSALYLKGEDTDPVFVGRVGQFCPIKSGCGGKELLRESKAKDGTTKYSAVTGTKGYLWLESEIVKTLQKEADIDRSYYDKMVNDAIEAISEYGDFEWFVSDDPYIPAPKNQLPPWPLDEVPY